MPSYNDILYAAETHAVEGWNNVVRYKILLSNVNQQIVN
ncbi:hypothetical protein SAMN05192574_103343 [Mucilaginibacter gossypiicola]|uniref:Uncharacterized protein n=1 Tax=Mucilaginibacter gossypiicola TaxID=551995 RepID=A0A1H8H2J5_9SPHI|nr:hypothetical protein SAMN05192574_103343 [Mucilaginibacter gossypiicola]